MDHTGNLRVGRERSVPPDSRPSCLGRPRNQTPIYEAFGNACLERQAAIESNAMKGLKGILGWRATYFISNVRCKTADLTSQSIFFGAARHPAQHRRPNSTGPKFWPVLLHREHPPSCAM
jgi:hypothetical protein